MPHLIEDSNVNVTSGSYKTFGGVLEVTCWADNWDSGQIEIQKRVTSPNTDTWVSLFDTVTGAVKLFTVNEQANINKVATGSEIRAVLSGAGGSASNINCEVKSVS
jgi:hypothetical protein